MRQLLQKNVLLALFLTLPLGVQAQTNPGSKDAGITGHSYWGFDLGITGSAYEGNQNFFWHMVDPSGTINTYVPFSDLGSGTGFLVGGKVAFPLSQSLDLEGKLRYLTNYTSKDETSDIALAIDPTTQKPSVTSSASNSYSLLLSNLSLAALVNLRVTDQWYGIGGFEFSTLLGNSIYVHQSLANGATYYFSNTGVRSNVGSLDHPSASESDYFTSTRAAFQIGAGSAFGLSKGSSTMLDVEFLLSIPFTQWLTSTGQGRLDTFAMAAFQPTISYPKLWYASLTIGIRFPFGGNGESPTPATESEQSTPSKSTQSEVGSDGKVPLTGTVTDSKTGKPIDATMTVVDLTSNEVVATDKTDGNGRYNIRVKAPGKYSVTADASGHLFGTAYFEVDPEGRILSNHPDIKLSETTNGRTRLLVFFDFNSSELKSSSYPELNRAVKLMKAVPTMQVEIAGYSDSIGTPEYNRQLSEKRASAVRDYLSRNGIAKSRVAAKGYGMDSPIADNSTEEGRAENRRVELVVLSK